MSWHDLIGFFVVGALLSLIGKGVSSIVFNGAPKAGCAGWRGVFYVTLWAHPIVAGAIVGYYVQIPMPIGLGESDVARSMWFALAGGNSNALYSSVRSVIKQIEARAKAERLDL